ARAAARAFTEGRDGRVELAQRAITGPKAADVLDEHLGVCFDCCHQAVLGEDLVASLRTLRGAGVPIGKIHLSSAIEGPPAALRAFDEPRYLHQVVSADGAVRADDLSDVDPAGPDWGDVVRARA